MVGLMVVPNIGPVVGFLIGPDVGSFTAGELAAGIPCPVFGMRAVVACGAAPPAAGPAVLSPAAVAAKASATKASMAANRMMYLYRITFTHESTAGALLKVIGRYA